MKPLEFRKLVKIVSFVLGEPDDLSLESDRGRKLKELREDEAPGCERLDKYSDIHGNPSGFFAVESYSKYILNGVFASYAARPIPEEWILMLHDAAPTHKRKRKQRERTTRRRQCTSTLIPTMKPRNLRVGLKTAGLSKDASRLA